MNELDLMALTCVWWSRWQDAVCLAGLDWSDRERLARDAGTFHYLT